MLLSMGGQHTDGQEVYEKKYDTAQNYRILHRVVQCLSQNNLKISHHRHI
jgi:hypothetical protein